MSFLPFTTATGIEFRKTIVGEGGLLCRDGTFDSVVAKEIKKSYDSLPIADKIVLDIGGNIGGFARYAALRGAKKVISIEPEESNFKCLQENTRGLGVICLRGCLDKENGETKIYLSTGINAGNTSQTSRRGRFSQTVPKISFTQIMEKYQPESVKIDCEGAEYNIGRASMWHPCVKNVCGEIHISGFGVEKAQQYADEYRDWIVVRAPIIKKTLWHTLGSWKRL